MNEPPRPRRRPLRAQAYDYSSPGAYFFTIVTQDRASVFGAVVDDACHSSPAGDVVARVWHELPDRFPSIELDAFVVMPNHAHGVLWILDTAPAITKLGDVVGAFKSISARAVNRQTQRVGSLWQRNYYERVVRNEFELAAIRQYIQDNPKRWALDEENPDR